MAVRRHGCGVVDNHPRCGFNGVGLECSAHRSGEQRRVIGLIRIRVTRYECRVDGTTGGLDVTVHRVHLGSSIARVLFCMLDSIWLTRLPHSQLSYEPCIPPPTASNRKAVIPYKRNQMSREYHEEKVVENQELRRGSKCISSPSLNKNKSLVVQNEHTIHVSKHPALCDN